MFPTQLPKMLFVVLLCLVLLSNASEDNMKYSENSHDDILLEDGSITEMETQLGMEEESSNSQSEPAAETVYYDPDYSNLSASKDDAETQSLTLCLHDKDCEDFTDENTGSSCDGKGCTCWDTRKKNETINCVVKSSKKGNMIGSKCPCAISTAECLENICICKSGYKKTEDRRNCIKMSLKLHEICVDNQQCTNSDVFSHCSNDICVCQEDYMEYKEKCVGVNDAKANCTDSDGCDDNSICTDRKCVCDEDSVLGDNKKCVKKSKYEEACTIDHQCKKEMGTGSECKNNACQCSSMYYNITTDEQKNITECVKYTTYGDPCITSNDCHNRNMDEHAQAYTCMDFECVCAEGYKMRKDSTLSHKFCSDKSNGSLLVVPSFYIYLILQFFHFYY